MNIKLLTFHRAVNYGAVLQAYALYKFIGENYPESQVSLYDYRCKKIEWLYGFQFRHESIKAGVIGTVNGCLDYIRKKKLQKFVYSHIKTEQSYRDSDFFIVGSDQVWSPYCTDFDKTFFLDFVKDKKRKNAYAASFGVDEIPPEYIEEYKLLLSGFHTLSVRELTGKKMIADLLQREIPVVLDPTLLLNKEKWAELRKSHKNKNPYILVYGFGTTGATKEFVERLSKRENLDVIVLTSYPPLKRKNRMKRAIYLSTVSPEEWITYFMDASYIVTNSFHGIAFSINFNKTFFAELLPPPAKVNSRIVDLLELFHLKDRLIEERIENSLYADINYEEVNRILNREREKSRRYIQGMIEDLNE